MATAAERRLSTSARSLDRKRLSLPTKEAALEEANRDAPFGELLRELLGLVPASAIEDGFAREHVQLGEARFDFVNWHALRARNVRAAERVRVPGVNRDDLTRSEQLGELDGPDRALRARQKWVEELAELGPFQHALLCGDRPSTVEDHKSRNGLNAQRGGEPLRPIDVDLNDLCFSLELPRNRLHLGRDRFARGAPVCVEVDEDGKLAAQDLSLEVLLSDDRQGHVPSIATHRPEGEGRSARCANSCPPSAVESFLSAAPGAIGRPMDHQVLWKGAPTQLEGPEIRVGQTAPSAFTLVASDMRRVDGADLSGKPRVLLTAPSVDTSVCDAEGRRFNQEATSLPGVRVIMITRDLPFALKRWCGAAGIDRVEVLSDHRERSFGPAYGVSAPDRGLLVRAVFVVGDDDVVRHVEYVPDVSQEPDYERALEAARALTKRA